MNKLEVKDLSFSYGESETLRNINFDVQAGEFVSILGHNGSGKTTLLRCISGYLKVQAGEILLAGKPVSIMPVRELARRMALVPQHALMEFDFTVRDIVLMGRNPHVKRFTGESEADYKAADAALEWTGMDALKNRSVLTLSGGEWQRTIVARAICQNSEILLLDEPVANLDVRHQIEILRMVRRLCRENGVSAICVMHDINLASHFSDTLLLLKGGKELAYGTSESVISEENLRNAYGIGAKVRSEQGRPFMIPEYD